MNRAVLLALLTFIIYGIQESQQQRCSDHYCASWNPSHCGCDGCCYGLGYRGGHCSWNKCYCYMITVRAQSGSAGPGPVDEGSTTTSGPAEK